MAKMIIYLSHDSSHYLFFCFLSELLMQSIKQQKFLSVLCQLLLWSFQNQMYKMSQILIRSRNNSMLIYAKETYPTISAVLTLKREYHVRVPNMV